MIDTDKRLLDPFPAPPMACLKRPVNLSEQLIRARLSSPRRVETRDSQVEVVACVPLQEQLLMGRQL